MREAWIIDAARSRRGIGKPGKGAFPSVLPHSIMATVVNALRDRIALVADEIDDSIIGCFGGRTAAFTQRRARATLTSWHAGLHGQPVLRFRGQPL